MSVFPKPVKIYAAIFLQSTSGMKISTSSGFTHHPNQIMPVAFCLKNHTVDGRLDKTSQMKLVVYPIIYKN